MTDIIDQPAENTEMNNNEETVAHNQLEDFDMEANFFSDEDEFTSAPSETHVERTVPLEPMAIAYTDFNEDPVFLYRMFYAQLFPWKTYFHWLNYDMTPTRNFTHREFSFTLVNDIYLRFKSFLTVEELKQEVERLQPIKIDIGAIYAVKPKDRKTVSETAFKPQTKELVFDIDMTDYDEIRTCCSGGDICNKCWGFMTIAIKIVDAVLKDDFGFEHVLWVYSGRRGVHCWVSDERARRLDDEMRASIVGYMEVIKGGSHVARKVNLPTELHPSLERAFAIIEQHFHDLVIKEQDILDTEEQYSKLLALVPDEASRQTLLEKFKETTSRAEKWGLLVKDNEAEQKKKFKDDYLRDAMFQYCYPRLDEKVSTNINHLLKSPFCVHPKTLKVCVPIDAEKCDSFDPMAVPNLTTLQKELNESAALNGDRRLADYKKTSLKPYIEYFEEFVQGLLHQVIEKKRVASDRSMEF